MISHLDGLEICITRHMFFCTSSAIWKNSCRILELPLCQRGPRRCYVHSRDRPPLSAAEFCRSVSNAPVVVPLFLTHIKPGGHMPSVDCVSMPGTGMQDPPTSRKSQVTMSREHLNVQEYSLHFFPNATNCPISMEITGDLKSILQSTWLILNFQKFSVSVSRHGHTCNRHGHINLQSKCANIQTHMA